MYFLYYKNIITKNKQWTILFFYIYMYIRSIFHYLLPLILQYLPTLYFFLLYSYNVKSIVLILNIDIMYIQI